MKTLYHLIEVIDKISFSNGSKLYLSSKPTHNDNFLRNLSSLNIQTVVVLLSKSELLQYYSFDLLQTYRKFGLQVIHYPIKDFSVPDSLHIHHRIIRQVVSQLKRHNILVHCSAGYGRTGLFAATVLIALGKNAEEAIDYIRAVRFGTIETETQEQFIHEYAEYAHSLL